MKTLLRLTILAAIIPVLAIGCVNPDAKTVAEDVVNSTYGDVIDGKPSCPDHLRGTAPCLKNTTMRGQAAVEGRNGAFAVDEMDPWSLWLRSVREVHTSLVQPVLEVASVSTNIWAAIKTVDHQKKIGKALATKAEAEKLRAAAAANLYNKQAENVGQPQEQIVTLQGGYTITEEGELFYNHEVTGEVLQLHSGEVLHTANGSFGVDPLTGQVRLIAEGGFDVSGQIGVNGQIDHEHNFQPFCPVAGTNWSFMMGTWGCWPMGPAD